MDENNINKVKITIGDASVEIEGEVGGITRIVESLKSVLQVNSARTAEQPSSTVPAETVNALQNIRSFFAEKNPHNNLEAAAAVAYFLQYVEKSQDSINAEILSDEFRKANWKLPKAITQVLIDARHAGYFDAAGVGLYRLNSVGYNLVHHALSNQGAESIKPRGIKRRKNKVMNKTKKR
jgi:hypothetical protein